LPARTDDQGHFRIAGLPVGKAYLYATVPRGSDVLLFARQFELQEGDNRFDLTPRGAGTLQVEVVGDTGKGACKSTWWNQCPTGTVRCSSTCPAASASRCAVFPPVPTRSGTSNTRVAARTDRSRVRCASSWGATELARARLDCSR